MTYCFLCCEICGKYRGIPHICDSLIDRGIREGRKMERKDLQAKLFKLLERGKCSDCPFEKRCDFLSEEDSCPRLIFYYKLEKDFSKIFEDFQKDEVSQ